MVEKTYEFELGELKESEIKISMPVFLMFLDSEFEEYQQKFYRILQESVVMVHVEGVLIEVFSAVTRIVNEGVPHEIFVAILDVLYKNNMLRLDTDIERVFLLKILNTPYVVVNDIFRGLTDDALENGEFEKRLVDGLMRLLKD